MILIAGDIHGKFKNLNRAIKEHKPSAIILLGDIEAEHNLNDELPEDANVWWIHGNHDYTNDQHRANIMDSRWANNNLHGRVVDFNGTKIGGLGGAFDENVWYPPGDPVHENLDSWDSANKHQRYFDNMRKNAEGAIFYDDYLNLMMEKADVLVAHIAPSCHPYGFTVIDELAQSMGVNRVFHGDHHDNIDYSADTERMGFYAHGVGLCGVTSIHGDVLIKGLLDDDRLEKRTHLKKNRM